jgi:DNA-binding CsgD family transcriptional regulator
MNIDGKTRQTIYQLWDELSSFPASEAESSLKHLLENLADMVDAGGGYVLSAMRLSNGPDKDPMQGWRPGPMFYFNGTEADRKLQRVASRAMDNGEPDESSLNHIRNAGRFRATLIRDHVSEEFFDTEHYQAFYRERGITDTMFVVAPVNEDSEVYVALHRLGKAPRFTPEDLEVAEFALRSLVWYFRQVLLSFGVLVAGEALTPTERKILSCLLTGMSEKEIADQLNQRQNTTHQYVVTLYRKFNVRSRAALTALWLGHD